MDGITYFVHYVCFNFITHPTVISLSPTRHEYLNLVIMGILLIFNHR